MQVDKVVSFIIEHSGKTHRDIAAECGRSASWASQAASGRIPQVDTLARLAQVAGLAVALVDTRTGDVVATVDPPTD